MGTRKLDEAVAGAATFRLLRTIELAEARRIRAELETVDAGDALVRGILTGRLRQLVTHARKWNRQLIIAERHVREVLMIRPRRACGSIGEALAGLRDTVPGRGAQ